MDWLIIGAFGLLVFGCRPALRNIPPPWLSLSRRKRGAMRLVLKAVAAQRLGRPDWSRCRVEAETEAGCFVVVSYDVRLSHAPIDVWVVPAGGGRAERLESSEFRFGRRPKDVVEDYMAGRTSCST